jgi:hypothetical protein
MCPEKRKARDAPALRLPRVMKLRPLGGDIRVLGCNP